MVYKKDKILSEEDIKHWNNLKKTVDLKLNNKINKTFTFKNGIKFNQDLRKIEPHNNLIIDEKKGYRKDIGIIPLKKSSSENIRIDKKKLNLLKRGKLKPEKILDLHGYNYLEAKSRSIDFVKENFSMGLRLILIITGKGSIKNNKKHGNPHLKEGILKKSLKSWIYESEMSPNILGIISSHISHGGEGAFYIYLKKNYKT